MNREEAIEISLDGVFTTEELEQRRLCIFTVRNYLGAGIAAARALRTIRDNKLFRPYKTMREFCERTFHITKQRAHQLIDFANTVDSLPPKSQPRLTSERQARELRNVSEEKRVEVLDAAQKDGHITAKAIKEAVAQVVEGELDKDGTPIPPKALEYWNRRDEVIDFLRHISAARVMVRNIIEGDRLYYRIGRKGEVLLQLDGIYNQFVAIVPEFVCGHCRGVNNIEGCKACNGTGLLSTYLRKNLPREERGGARPF